MPQSGQEWDALIARCVLAQRQNLLDQVRGILLGGAALPEQDKDAKTEIDQWTVTGVARWRDLVTDGAPEPAKF